MFISRLLSLFVVVFVISYNNSISAQIENFEIEYPHNTHTSGIAIDEEGYVWFPNAEENDFYRYSGQDLHLLGLPEILDEPIDQYSFKKPIFVEGRLMVPSQKKISLYNHELRNLETLWELPDSQTIEYVYQDDESGVFIFTSDDSKNVKPVYYAKQGKTFEFAFDLNEHFGSGKAPYWANLNDANGLLYFYGYYSGLIIVNYEGEKQDLFLKDVQDFEDKFPCTVFRLDNKNRLWRLYKKDVEIYDPSSGSFVRLPLSGRTEVNTDCPESSDVTWSSTVIWEDNKGRTWIGGEDSYLFMVDMATGQVTIFAKKLIDDMGGRGASILALVEDDNGNIYGSKRGGVFKISEKTNYFDHFLTDTKEINHPIYTFEKNSKQETAYRALEENEIVNTDVLGLAEDANGNIFTSDFRFVFKIDPNSKKAEVLPHFGNTSGINLDADKGRKIVSLWGSVYHFDNANKLTYLENPPSRLENILFQKNGNIWYSGYQSINHDTYDAISLFAKVDTTTLEYESNYIDPEGKIDFNERHVYSMSEDENGNICLGTEKGIITIDQQTGKVEDKGTSYKWKDSLIVVKHFIKVQCLGENKVGFNTSEEFGILNTANNTLEGFVKKEALALDRIYCSYFVNENEAWVGSKSLLSYYNFTTSEYINFSSEDGLKISRVSKFIKPLTTGQLVVGTDNGLNLFYPEPLLQSHKQNSLRDQSTQLKLTYYSSINGKTGDVSENNQFSNDQKQLFFNYNDKVINFKFSLLDFTNPATHTFSYWMKGIDKKWTDPVRSNTREYTNLPAGKYTLKVKAHNGNGVWSQNEINVDIKVKPAWYKTWWFLALCLLAFLAVAYAIVKHYLGLEKGKLELFAKEKEAKQLKELDDAKNLFFTNITHEFRTPLTVIKGVNENSDALEKEKSLIRRNSNNLLQLINHLLDLSKLESRKLKLNLSQGDIVKYIEYLTASFFSMAVEKKIQLEFQSEVEELTMNFDELRTQQIIYNLLSNALKFTPEGGSIKINLAVENEELQKLRITIQDSGHGIPKQDIPHLFDHFYQVSNSVTKIGEGTGIGLSLTKELVELMEGEIRVTSTLNQGSAFVVVLPIRSTLSDELIPSNFDIDKEAVLPYISNKTTQNNRLISQELNTADENLPILLLIEDNADIVTYICSILEEKYQIVISINGEIGIEKAIEIIPDIIISDVMMPIKDGYEVCKTLKQHENTDHIPIILLTAKANVSDRLEGLKYGADAYINKPFLKEELLIRLDQLLLVRKKIQEKYSKQIIAPQEVLTDEKDAFFNKLKEVIITNMSNHLFGVPEMANALFMSQPQVYRKSKALLDKTPTAVINMMRLNKAKELLINTTDSISEIAAIVGYKDANYFSRVFQNKFRSSPSVFRNRQTSN